MGNHLHEFVSCLDKKDVLFISDAMKESQIDHVYKMAKKASSEAICFYAGEFEDLLGFKVIDELVRLPYPTCWIEFSCGDIFGTMLWEIDGVINAQVWRKHCGTWLFMFAWDSSIKGKSSVGYFHQDASHRVMQATIACVRCFITAMNCTNINRIEHAPSEKLQKARIKRGKKPLFSYWTLEVDLPKSRKAGEDFGGTHASPRLHLRKCHPREYAPGKWCWVSAHPVGRKELGIIHKDYAAKYSPNQPDQPIK